MVKSLCSALALACLFVGAAQAQDTDASVEAEETKSSSGFKFRMPEETAPAKRSAFNLGIPAGSSGFPLPEDVSGDPAFSGPAVGKAEASEEQEDDDIIRLD